MNQNYIGSPPLPIQAPNDQSNLMDPSDRYIQDPLSLPFNLKHLPIANITRIMKQSLKPKAKVSKNAKETVQECVSEFISFITSEAAQRSKMDKRKTVNGEDILTSLEVLGFEKYAEILRIYLTKYRHVIYTKSKLNLFDCFLGLGNA